MINQDNLEFSDIDEKIKQLAEKENISFLKTYIIPAFILSSSLYSICFVLTISSILGKFIPF